MRAGDWLEFNQGQSRSLHRHPRKRKLAETIMSISNVMMGRHRKVS